MAVIQTARDSRRSISSNIPPILPCIPVKNKPTASDLHVAIHQGNLLAVKKLLSAGGDPNITLRGSTPLSLAVYRGHDDIANELILAGANVSKMSRDHLDRVEPPLFSACRLGNIRATELFLHNSNVDINQRDFFNKTPLWIATKERRLDLVRLLVAHNANVNIAETWSECPLYIATKYKGRRAIAHLLIRSGCRIGIADSEGLTPLFWSVKHGDKGTFTLLVHAGAKVQRYPWLEKSALSKQWQENAELCEWIEKLQTEPMPLSWIARNCVRRWLSLRWNQLKSSIVDTLPIPEIMKIFILLENVQSDL